MMSACRSSSPDKRREMHFGCILEHLVGLGFKSTPRTHSTKDVCTQYTQRASTRTIIGYECRVAANLNMGDASLQVISEKARGKLAK